MSFPSRERGLKSKIPHLAQGAVMSFPSRERGLKSIDTDREYIEEIVVPFAGTWIEIY